MIQILFGLGYDNGVSTSTSEALREICVMFDKIVYTLIGYVYNILFNIADVSILQSSVLKDFYQRIELILGVVMIFKISLSLMQYVINPDAFSDKKNGFGKIISRIIMVLVMITAIIPLNIPESKENSYNDYLNHYGLLFGTLYSLQHRIISSDTIFKLVLGEHGTSISIEGEEDTDIKDVNSKVGERVATYILKGFISINTKKRDDGSIPSIDELKNDDYMVLPSSNVDSMTLEGLFWQMLGDNVSEYITHPINSLILPLGIGKTAKNNLDNIFGYLKDYINNKNQMGYYYRVWLNAQTPEEVTQLINISDENGVYGFAYMPIISTICGVILLILIFSYCIDVAVRTLKLAVLQLISPIAIISYIDPKSSEKGAFANWCKLLVSTYLDLFLRIAILAFITFLSLQITSGSLDLPDQLNGIYNFIATIFIILGLFFFARIAPKFISDALGIKGMGAGLGISGVLGAAGALMGGAGLSGSLAGGLTAMNNASEAAATGKQAPSAWSTGSDLAAKIRTGDPNAKGGFTQSWQRAAMNLAANRHGFGQAVKDKKYFGDESEAARQHINQLNRDIAAEQGNLSSLKSQQESNNAHIQNIKDALKNNFSEDMRNRIHELRRNGSSDSDIMSKLSNDYSGSDLLHYFGAEKALSNAMSKEATLKGQISASEAKISAHQSELRETEVYKGEMEYNKGKSQEGVDKMYKIYGNIGNASQKDDSRYSARARNGRPW